MNHPVADAAATENGYYRRLQAAVEELLILKGIVGRDEIDREVAAMEERSYRRGAAVVAHAWVDPACKNPHTLHHRGRGRFALAGETICLPSRMK